MLTSELAKKVGVTPETVRFYTRKGLIQATKQPENGYHIYDRLAMNHLKFISNAKAIGFSLKEIEKIIQLSNKEQSPCPQVRDMLNNRINETERKIESLQQHLAFMKNAFSDWSQQPDLIPNGHNLCHLIDNWSETEKTSHLKENYHE